MAAADRKIHQGDLFASMSLDDPLDVNRVFQRTIETDVPRTARSATLNPSTVLQKLEKQDDAAVKVDASLDAGEELLANRRGRGNAGLKWVDISSSNDTLKTKEIIKQNIWPKPDYDELIAGGMNPVVAFFVKHVYDSTAIRPKLRAGQALNDDIFQSYIDVVSYVRKTVLDWASNADNVRQYFSENRFGNYKNVRKNIPTGGNPFVGKSFIDRFNENKNEINDAVIGGYDFRNAVSASNKIFKKTDDSLENGWPAKREAWQVQGYEILSEPEKVATENKYSSGVFYAEVGGRYLSRHETMEAAERALKLVDPYVVFKEKRFIASHLTYEDALASVKSVIKKEKTHSVSDKGTSVLEVERVGPLRRELGEDISSEKILQVFGFKGINFGNWMKTSAARLEAQMHQNYIYDSLHDLAEILGVPPRAVALDGMLGLAVGAQGSGGAAAAHFVPGISEINITRTSGAGSLGHEWAHGLDHYFATQSGFATNKVPYLSEHSYSRISATLRPEISLAMKGIVEAMTQRTATLEEEQRRFSEAQEKRLKNIESFIKYFRKEAGLKEGDSHAKLDSVLSKIRSGDFGGDKIKTGRGPQFCPTIIALRSTFEEIKGKPCDLENCERLQRAMDSCFDPGRVFKYEAPKVNSVYLNDALALDKEKGGSAYWSTTRELFARAFDVFLTDELAKRNIKNSYLSHSGRTGPTVPSGEERAKINVSFLNLVGVLKTLELDERVTLYTKKEGQVVLAPLEKSVLDEELVKMRKKWNAMPSVTVVDHAADIDQLLDSNAQGIFKDGKVWLVRSNLGSVEDLRRVVAHECVLHHSLIDMLGTEKFTQISNGIQALKRSGDQTVVGLAADVFKSHGALTARDESAEIIARAGERCMQANGEIKIRFGFMKGVLSNVSEWLRGKGFDVKVTNTEIAGLIHRSVVNISKKSASPIVEPRDEEKMEGNVSLGSTKVSRFRSLSV